MSRRSHFDEFFRLNGPSEFSCKTLVLVLDAERAARAAPSIQQALADLNRKNAGAGKPELGARIGLETGPAVADGGRRDLQRCHQRCGAGAAARRRLQRRVL
jgi:class 3 adenylate cyclase